MTVYNERCSQRDCETAADFVLFNSEGTLAACRDHIGSMTVYSGVPGPHHVVHVDEIEDGSVSIDAKWEMV